MRRWVVWSLALGSVLATWAFALSFEEPNSLAGPASDGYQWWVPCGVAALISGAWVLRLQGPAWPKAILAVAAFSALPAGAVWVVSRAPELPEEWYERYAFGGPPFCPRGSFEDWPDHDTIAYVDLNRHGELAYSGQPVTLNQLMRRLKADTRSRIRLHADRETAWGHVAWLIASARAARLPEVELAVSVHATVEGWFPRRLENAAPSDEVDAALLPRDFWKARDGSLRPTRVLLKIGGKELALQEGLARVDEHLRRSRGRVFRMHSDPRIEFDDVIRLLNRLLEADVERVRIHLPQPPESARDRPELPYPKADFATREER